MKIKKIWSMSTFRLLFLVVVVVIPVNILTLVLSSTTVNEVEKQMYEETQHALELYMNQIDGVMERITMKMHLLAVEDIDFARINNKEITEQEEYYNQLQSAVNLHNTLGTILQDHELITGVYVIYPEKDFDIMESRSNHYISYRTELAEYVRQQVAEETWDGLRKWRVTDVKDNVVLLFVANYQNAYYGAWIDLALLADYFDFTERNSEIATMFVKYSGEICYNNAEPEVAEQLAEMPEKKSMQNIVRIEAASKYADFSLVQLLSKSEINNALPVLIRVLQIASFVALIILPLIVLSMQKWIIKPVRRLTDAMEKIEAGNVSFRIEEAGAGSEFEQINHNFNSMMDEVSRLKIDVYEEKLEKQQIKMRFLSQQIQPHFILNAMNILYSYEQEEYPLIQKMILCLTKYFRYIVNANSEFVVLHEEMDHIRNYFEIQQVRWSKTFFAMVEYDEEIADCLVPPLLIQNFAENAIKHSLKIGNNIDIFVIAQKLGENAVRIRMMDTGEGINEELIEKVKRFRETGEYQEGLGVGIQNAVERLNVLYGVETKFEITRDEPHGTRIEIVLQLHYAEDEEDD